MDAVIRLIKDLNSCLDLQAQMVIHSNRLRIVGKSEVILPNDDLKSIS